MKKPSTFFAPRKQTYFPTRGEDAMIVLWGTLTVLLLMGDSAQNGLGYLPFFALFFTCQYIATVNTRRILRDIHDRLIDQNQLLLNLSRPQASPEPPPVPKQARGGIAP